MKGNIKNIVCVLGIMLLSSAFLLLLLTLAVWKMDGGGNLLTIGVIGTYIITGLIGGCLIGKAMGTQKFLWGLLVGFLYFLILFFLGVFVVRINIKENVQIISGAMICSIAGMIGGMFSSGT